MLKAKAMALLLASLVRPSYLMVKIIKEEHLVFTVGSFGIYHSPLTTEHPQSICLLVGRCAFLKKEIAVEGGIISERVFQIFLYIVTMAQEERSIIQSRQ